MHTLSGATVTYCYTVTNTGDTAVGGVTLIDDRAMIAIGSLAAGQSADATGTLVATVDTDTAAVASGVSFRSVRRKWSAWTAMTRRTWPRAVESISASWP